MKNSIHNSQLSPSEIDDYIMEKYKDSEEDFLSLIKTELNTREHVSQNCL